MRGSDSGYAVGTSGSPQSSIDQASYATKVVKNEKKLAESVSGGTPDFSKATVDEKGKLKGYCLNPDHPVGKNKARVFESALGFTQGDAPELAKQIKEGVKNAKPVPGKTDKYGSRYTVDVQVTGRNGRTVTVETAWIIRPGSTEPSLVAAFVKKEKNNA